ncbi:MAG: ABC transporter permease subunit [Planctomycetales bacterium]
MRPYLAVLKDSFREAIASRVLLIVLIVATLGLMLLAPFGMREQRATKIRRGGLTNPAGLIAKVDEQRNGETPSPGGRIWERWGDALKAKLKEREEQGTPDVSGDLAESLVSELNRLLDDRTLYDAQAWKGVALNEEGTALQERAAAGLTGEELPRFNRLLLEGAFPKEIARGGGSELFVTYLGISLGDSWPMTRKEALPMVKSILAGIMDFFVGTLGVLAAVLVTASIIPQTFEAGAIDLLLSKPVSRSLLFLTKFLGGCAFILVSASYFIVGLWLIAGLRFDLWSGRVLLCIPLFLFLFAVYYSVSSLAGVLWRNAIVSVVVTIVFWAACFLVGATKAFVEAIWINPEMLVKLVPAGDSLLGVTETGEVREWRNDNSWEQVFHPDQPPMRAGPVVVPQPLIGPAYDHRADRIVAVPSPPRGGFPMFGTPTTTLAVGKRSDGWTRKKSLAMPAGTTALLVGPQEDILVIGGDGVSRLVSGDRTEANPDAPQERFVASGPEPRLPIDQPFAAAIHPDDGRIAVWNHGLVTLLAPDAKGQYQRQQEGTIAAATEATSAVLAYGGSTLLVALADGRTLIVDPSDLSVRKEVQPSGGNPPRFAFASPGGRWFAVLFHNRQLWLYDEQSQAPVTVRVSGQGNVTAAAFDGPGTLLVTDRGQRVTRYRLDPFQQESVRTPTQSGLQRAFYYGLVPLHTVFPRPGELKSVSSYLLTEQETVATGPNADDLTQNRVKIDIAGPIWNSLAFLTVMLTLTCLYVWRTDF